MVSQEGCRLMLSCTHGLAYKPVVAGFCLLCAVGISEKRVLAEFIHSSTMHKLCFSLLSVGNIKLCCV
jgi:hypothetical protein